MATIYYFEPSKYLWLLVYLTGRERIFNYVINHKYVDLKCPRGILCFVS